MLKRTVNIKGGTLSHAINLLYLLDAEPHLHRLDSLSLSPSPELGKVDVQFKYSTLAMESACFSILSQSRWTSRVWLWKSVTGLPVSVRAKLEIGSA